MIVERRFGESADQLRAGAVDLVRIKVDVLFVRTVGLGKLVQRETKTIPIVVGSAEGDLVASGLVDSLAKPGGNITGSQILDDDLVPKRLELLKALLPNLSRVALLREDVATSALPQTPTARDQQTVNAARTLAIDIHPFVVRGAEDLAAAFPSMLRNQDRGVLVTTSAFMFVHRQAVVDLCRRASDRRGLWAPGVCCAGWAHVLWSE